MSTPRDTPSALSDITNITDDARRTREEWNLRRRVRRAEMSAEQQEEARRKGREYQRQRRERQRAESQNIGATSSLPGTNHDTTSENFSLLLDKENVQPTEDGDHIHGVIGTAITIGSRLTVDSGSHNFSMDQRSQIVLNNDNTGPTAVGNHSHAGLDIEGIANTSMDKRNTQQRKRRAEMTAEQLEAKRRKNAEYQRQYRARKKAELQHANNTSNDNQANVGASSQFAGFMPSQHS